MTNKNDIINLGLSIGREFNAEKVILFGSHAYGNPSTDSDVDLLVIMKFKGKSAWKSLEILNRFNPNFGVDLLVRTPEQITRRIEYNDFFIKEILNKGEIIYESGRA